MSRRTLVVVSAGLSQPSSTRLLADRLAAATRGHLADRDIEVAVEVVELREHAQALANNLLTGFPATALKEAVARVVGGDGLVVVSPIFNASFSGLFKMFFDVVEQGELAGKPVLLGATGGTARHSLAIEHAMRPLFAYLQAVTAPTAVYAATEDWGSATDGEDALETLSGRIDRAGREMAGLLAMTEPVERADELQAPTPFEELLAGR